MNDNRGRRRVFPAQHRRRHGHRGTRALRVDREVRVGDEVLTAEQIFVNVGGRAVGARDARNRPTCRSSTNSLDDGRRLRARRTSSSSAAATSASSSPRCTGASGARSRSSRWRRGSSRARTRTSPKRSGDPGARRHRRAHWTPKCIALAARTASGVRVGVDCADGEREGRSAPTCCSPSGRRPNTDDLGLDRAGVAHGRARLHRRRRRAPHERARHLGARRLQRPRRVHAHLLQRLRDRRREPARRRPAPRQRPHPRLRALHRSAARPRRHDRDARRAQSGARVARRQAPDDARRTRGREGRDARLHEDHRRRATRRRSSAPRSSATGGDEVVHVHARRHVREGALHGRSQRAMHIHPTVAELLPTVLGSLQPA